MRAADATADAARYRAARAEAQLAANADGLDRGIERVCMLGSLHQYRVSVLPRRENRQGHELRCEVISCEDLARCQPGHGPEVRRAEPRHDVILAGTVVKRQDGYPPHERILKRYDTGADQGSCGRPLVLSEQALVRLDPRCAECHHDAHPHETCAALLGTVPCVCQQHEDSLVLYCVGCKLFLVVEEREIEMARAAANKEGFLRPPTEALRPPTEKAGRARLDPSQVTVNMFPDLPQYHAKVGANGRAR